MNLELKVSYSSPSNSRNIYCYEGVARNLGSNITGTLFLIVVSYNPRIQSSTGQAVVRELRKQNTHSYFMTKEAESQFRPKRSFNNIICKRHNLAVKTSSLPGIPEDVTVIHPMEFDMGICGGIYCYGIIPSHRYSFMVELQLLRNSDTSFRYSYSCLPTRFSDLSILYLKGNRIVKQVYKKLILEHCDCYPST